MNIAHGENYKKEKGRISQDKNSWRWGEVWEGHPQLKRPREQTKPSGRQLEASLLADTLRK